MQKLQKLSKIRLVLPMRYYNWTIQEKAVYLFSYVTKRYVSISLLY